MVAEGNVGLAFGLVFIAGAASMIGFLPVLWLKRTKSIYLAFALGFAAGLMIFVSLVEILIEGCIGSFEAAGYSEGASMRYAMLLFFAGCTLVLGMDLLMGIATPYAHVPMMAMSRSWKRIKSWRSDRRNTEKRMTSVASIMESGGVVIQEGKEEEDKGCRRLSCDPVVCDPVLCEPDTTITCPCQDEKTYQNEADKGRMSNCEKGSSDGQQHEAGAEVDEHRGEIAVAPCLANSESIWKLKRMGMLVAFSMAVHNLPEGMAVFLGALEDSKFGATIAIAIAVHNIPEGFCISLPVYYATGSKWKAFFWTLIPSMAEPLGGVIAYFSFEDAGDLAFGIAFGIVAGIMVYISVMELLPAAFKFDPDNKLVTIACMLGMVIMAFSFILLSL